MATHQTAAPWARSLLWAPACSGLHTRAQSVPVPWPLRLVVLLPSQLGPRLSSPPGALSLPQANLTKSQNEFKIVLKELEDSLLARLSAASGNFLGDTALVENLETTKHTASEIEEKVRDHLQGLPCAPRHRAPRACHSAGKRSHRATCAPGAQGREQGLGPHPAHCGPVEGPSHGAVGEGLGGAHCSPALSTHWSQLF